MMGEVAESPTVSSSLRILVVEDDRICQKLATAVLERSGHIVTIAENGRAAVKQVEVTSFDLILMDVMMPEMDGLEATRIIRRREKETGARVVPIVAVTAASDRESCLAAGMDEFIAKPIRSGELAATIERVLVLP